MSTLTPTIAASEWTVEDFLPNARIALESHDQLVRRGFIEPDLQPKAFLPLPSHFCCELVALNILSHWERTGAMTGVPVSLPKYDECFNALTAQLQYRPEHFLDGEPFGHLFKMTLWTFFVSRTYSRDLGCRFSPGWLDDDALVEALAQLLWANRRDIAEAPATLPAPEPQAATVLHLLDDLFSDFVAEHGEQMQLTLAKAISKSTAATDGIEVS